MDITMLVLAAATLAILVWQEVRRHRETPRPRLTAEVIGTTVISDEQWSLVDVSNVGDAPASLTLQSVFGVELRRSYSTGDPHEGRLPNTIAPGASHRLAVRGDFDAAWIHFSYVVPGQRRAFVSWRPISVLGEETLARRTWQSQWDEQISRRSRFRRRKIVPVGPFVGGVASLRLPAASKITPEKMNVALGIGARVLDGFEPPYADRDPDD
ncbi:MAG: hypothetical protein P1U38_03660 [Aeromicrobium sp.]|uniref:hypothetical protein n=1 Tax=Aeromicrobium sp. TaxID=1871063 RepID=UPI0026086936|nr:hypothetical protein [Aeromicrobium sp.]MDF1703846.1 hypothetical protein [Aeromicrobium sp.]